MDFIIKALLFIVIISAVIFIHEAGHFILAKKNGIRVYEFSIGIGPKLISIQKGETVYAIRLLPFGGYCAFTDLTEFSFKNDIEEEFVDESGSGEEADDIFSEDDPRSFENSPVLARLATVLAGPFFNFFLAFFLSLFIIGSIGYDAPVVAGVMDGYPAKEAGLMAGDEIVSIGGKNIVVYRDISVYNMFSEPENVEIKYRRDGKLYSTYVKPVYSESDGRILFGIAGSVGRVKANPLQVIRYSAHEVVYWIDLSCKSIGMLFKGKVKKDDVAGPVGVAQTVGEVYDNSKSDGGFYVWLNMMNLTVLLTANLGVMNLLPFPALDGGRIVFLLVEFIFKKRVKREVESAINLAGTLVLVAIMVFVLFNDVSKFM